MLPYLYTEGDQRCVSHSNRPLQGPTIYGIYIPFLKTRSGDFVGTPPQVENKRSVRGGGARYYQSLRFQTFRHNDFKFYYDLFYPLQRDPKVAKRTVVSGKNEFLKILVNYGRKER